MIVAVNLKEFSSDKISEIARVEICPDDKEKHVENISTKIDILNFVLTLSKLMEVSPLDKRHVIAEPIIKDFIVKIQTIETLPETTKDTIDKLTVKTAIEILVGDFSKINFKNNDFEIYVEQQD